jgi:hypothetical protein
MLVRPGGRHRIWAVSLPSTSMSSKWMERRIDRVQSFVGLSYLSRSETIEETFFGAHFDQQRVRARLCR